MAGDKDGARVLLVEALGINTEFHGDTGAEYTFYNGLGWSSNDFDPEQAIVHYRRATQIVPLPAPQAHFNLAILLTAKGDRSGAIEVYKHLYHSHPPEPGQLHDLAKLEVDAGRARDAVATLKSVKRAYPNLDALKAQKTTYFLAQAHMLLHEWTEASAAFANVVRLGLTPLAGTYGCDQWRVAEGWEDGPDVTVTALAPPAGADIEFTDPLTGQVHRDSARSYWLIRMTNVLLDGDKHHRIYHAGPKCTFYIGEMSASAMPQGNWGAERAPGEPPGQRVHVKETAIVLLDTIGKHSGFYHLQTDLISRVLYFLRDVYDPSDARWQDAVFLVTPASQVFLEELRASGRAAAFGVHLPAADRLLPLAHAYLFDNMYMVDWSTPIAHAELGAWIGDQSWRSYSDPLYNLHLPPGALLRLQHALMRPDGASDASADDEDEDDNELDFSPQAKKKSTPAPAPKTSPIRIAWISRRDSRERNVVGEDRIIDGLRAEFGMSAVEIFGRDDPNDPGASQRYDIAGGRRTFGTIDIIVGPHGAGLCNVLFAERAAMVLLPLCDSVGCPAAQDVYFTYIAAALGVKLVIPEGPRGESAYLNYTVTDGPEQVDGIVRIVRELVAEQRGTSA